MFTGIVEELGRVSLIQPDKLSVKARKVIEGVPAHRSAHPPSLLPARSDASAKAGGGDSGGQAFRHAGVAIGDSMAVNGACLTITAVGADSFSVEVMPETLRRTNIGRLRVGDEVNLERALRLGGRVGGHFVQGHVDDTGRVSEVKPEGPAVLMRFTAPRGVLRYVVLKGFIAVDGTSLTVVEKDESSFVVSLVGLTRQSTTLGKRRVGDTVNIEVDIIAKYVEAFTKSPGGSMTLDFLQEHGFAVE